MYFTIDQTLELITAEWYKNYYFTNSKVNM